MYNSDKPILMHITYTNLFQVDKGTLDFEGALADILLDFSEETNINQDGNIKTYVSLARSFDDLANQAIGADIPRIIGGVSIVYAYVLMMLGGFDCVQQKVQLQYQENYDLNSNFPPKLK